MRTQNSARLRTTARAAVLAACAAALACSRAAEPATTAPAAAPPPPPAAEPTPSPAEQAQPAAPAAAPASMPESNAPRDLLDEDREERKDHALKPKSSSVEEPSRDELATAQADLERARVTLNRALASGRARSAASAPAPSTAGGASRGAGAAAPPAKAEKKADESSCTTACNAFSSLARAASAVCRITGEKDGRCGHAHAVVADAQKRISVCSCVAG